MATPVSVTFAAPCFCLVEGSADQMASEAGTGGFRGQKWMNAMIFFQISFCVMSSSEAFWVWGFFLNVVEEERVDEKALHEMGLQCV